MTRRARLKAWVKTHREDLVIGGILGAAAVGTIAFMVAIVKSEMAAQERAQAELNNRIDELNAWHQDVKLAEFEERLLAG